MPVYNKKNLSQSIGEFVKTINHKRRLLIPFREKSININHKKKFIYIHIPKTAGTSIKKSLDLNVDTADHRTPSIICNPKTWEAYFTFTIVRHPIDRFISSYSYHTDKKYNGVYLTKYPKLTNLNIDDYFDLMIDEKYGIIPQVEYVIHKGSHKKIDFICKFENLQKDVNDLFLRLGIKNKLPHLNKSNRIQTKVILSDELTNKLIKFYRDDFTTFNYVPNKYFE